MIQEATAGGHVGEPDEEALQQGLESSAVGRRPGGRVFLVAWNVISFASLVGSRGERIRR